MASIRPSIDHTLAVWLINHFNTNPPADYGNKLIADQITDIYTGALNKAGLASLIPSRDSTGQSTGLPVIPVLPLLKSKYPLETELTSQCSTESRDKAVQLVKSYTKTDGKPSADTDIGSILMNQMMFSYYQSNCLAIEHSGTPDQYTDREITPLDKTVLINTSDVTNSTQSIGDQL